MEPTTQNQAPQSASPAMPPMKQKSAGPVIGIVIIVIILIVGALYFYGARLNQQTPTEQPPLSSSDSVEDISADLSATVINGVDSDVEAMGAELQ